MEQVNYNYRQNPYTLITALYKNSNWKKKSIQATSVNPWHKTQNRAQEYGLGILLEKYQGEKEHSWEYTRMYIYICVRTHTYTFVTHI